MFKALFNIILNLLATVIQLICWPINTVIEATLPDLSETLHLVNSVIVTYFSAGTWAIGIIPDFVVEVLLFILTIEIAKHTVFKSTHMITKVWNVLQKIKFW